MKDASYEFDPCEIDGSDEEEEDVTLDNWQPMIVRKKIGQSNWRKEQIDGDYNQQPTLDDIRKIHGHLDKGAPDYEIMEAFGINCETLSAIKKDKYCPVDGIKMDTLNKIYKHYDYIEKKLQYLWRGNNYLAKLLFMDDISLKKFHDYCEKKQKPKSKNNKESV